VRFPLASIMASRSTGMRTATSLVMAPRITKTPQ
jgi:hypothetical protein